MFFEEKKKQEAQAQQAQSMQQPLQKQREQPPLTGTYHTRTYHLELPEILEKHREYLESTLCAANEIAFVAKETKPWESKLGGCPYLENAEQYPTSADGRPMMFFAQINLEEMPPLPDFPTKGLLQFYVEEDDAYGFDQPFVIRYLPDYHKEEGNLLKENPYQAGYRRHLPFSVNCRITFSQKQVPVGPECGTFVKQFEDKVPKEELMALYEVCDASGSKVGGYPYFLQSTPSYYDDGQADVLLLQLDVDDVSGMMFGDGGNCNFLISREDLLKLDFSKAEYDWQCY